MTAPERIIEQLRRVKNLMENAGTDGEAAAAAAAMARLLQRYNLDLADIPTGDSEQLDENIYGDEQINIQEGLANWKWKVDLTHKLAIYNFCTSVVATRTDHSAPRVYSARDLRWIKDRTEKHGVVAGEEMKARLGHWREVHYMILVGKRHNTEVVRFLYDVITRKLEELSKAYPISNPRDLSDFAYDSSKYGTLNEQLRRHLWNEHDVAFEKMVSRTRSIRYSPAPMNDEELEAVHLKKHSATGQGQLGPRKSFLYGAVMAINNRLYTQWMAFQKDEKGKDNSKALAVINSKALAVINNNAVAIKSWMDENLPTVERSNNDLSVDGKAFAEGQRAGRAIQFQQGVGGGKSGVGTKSLGSGR